MTTANTPPLPTVPAWPHCGRGADPAAGSVGCRGRKVEPYTGCLAHLTDAELSTHLGTLSPGSALDHRGTLLAGEVLERLLGALRDPATGRPHLGDARFEEAVFPDDAGFLGVRFSGDAAFHESAFSGRAAFDGAVFTGNALFDGAAFSRDALFGNAAFGRDATFRRASFSGDVTFRRAVFSGNTWFHGATFSGETWFRRAAFSGSAVFDEASFSRDCTFHRAAFARSATFRRAVFSARTDFHGAEFSDDVLFADATFENALQVGPLVCRRTLDLCRARFQGPVTIEAAASRLLCVRTRWDSSAALRLRYAAVDLSDAVFEYPLSITARPVPFTQDHAVVTEALAAGRDPGVRVVSLRGVDAAHLVLHDVDLSGCLFTGTVHLDHLRLEGDCLLASTPSHWRRRGLLPVPPTDRRTLAEEHHWRASRGRPGWTAAPNGTEVVGPAQLAPVYRQLRKSFEDSKNEPDAADFYYGEMEMRRHDRRRPRGERWLLTLYWAVSGYGLRASRALGWLMISMAATVLVLMLWGLPAQEPSPVTSGRLTGHDITLNTDKPDPVNPGGPLASRLTSERWEKSMRIVVNSVVFRSSGQDLTTTGTYTEMASRLVEPVLLGLAALAVRGRVKR
ncbi:pentapeptide repeat-containing protein [Streptomyces sp. NPDC035033]|uniref:pentapeptide repeat-containing protein n=1 Tax=Streptomyces sp. NPDC035033 TaxID=3155368 RepID=UPI0033FFD69F